MWGNLYTYFARSKVSQAKQGDFIVGCYLIVVSWVGKCKRQHALLLQIGFVNTCEGLDDNGSSSQVTGFKGSMLSRTALTYRIG